MLDKEGKRRLPDWWQRHFDPCVVYLYHNACYGVTFKKFYMAHPRKRPELKTAMRELAALPAWAEQRLAPLS